MPKLLGWPRTADPEAQKALETMLHLGTAGALALERRQPELPASVRALMLAPAVVAGYAFERPIERRLGSPRAVAVAQVVAGAALFLADRRPASRSISDVSTADIAALGVAQAVALIPGVSRSGAIVTVARVLGFDRASSQELSDEAAQPVLVGAAALKGLRLLRSRPPRETVAALAAGALSALASTVAASRLLERETGGHRFRACGLYRVAMGASAFALSRRCA